MTEEDTDRYIAGRRRMPKRAGIRPDVGEDEREGESE